MDFDALVLDAQLRQSLVTVRSLGRRGLRVAAAGPTPDLPTFASRWCSQAVGLGVSPGGDGYLDLLERWLDANRARVLYSSHDGTIALIRSRRPELERRARVALAAEPALAIAVNKERTLALATSLGIAIPRQAVIRSFGDVAPALHEVGLPAVIKPSESWLDGPRGGHWVGSQVVATVAEAQQAAEVVTGAGSGLLCQQLLSGRREAVSILYADGDVRARFAQWASRTNPQLGGQSVLRQAIAIPPDIGHAAELLVRSIGLEGYSEIEFRRDAAGTACLMEINSRLSASVEIAVRSGVDFPFLLYQWASGGPVERADGYRAGRWMRHLGGDVESTIEAVVDRGKPGLTPPLRAVLGFFLAFLRPAGYDYLVWNDPLPAARASASFARYWAGRLVTRIRKVVS